MVIVLTMLALVMTGMVLMGARHQDLSLHRIETARSFYAAEAGIHMALREVMLATDEDGSGTVGGIDGTAFSLPALGGADVTVAAVESDGYVVLDSLGQWNDARRRTTMTVLPPSEGGDLRAGLAAYYYRSPHSLRTLSQVAWNDTPSAMTLVDNIDWPVSSNSQHPFWVNGPNNWYGARFVGFIHIDQPGVWTFHTESDDGSRLWINDEEVVVNDGLHDMRRRQGTIELEEGWHDFEVRYFENQGNHGLIASWEGPGVPHRTVIPPEAFAHSDQHLVQPVPQLAVREHMYLWGQGPGWHCFIDTFTGSTSGIDPASNDRVLVSSNDTSTGTVQMSRSTVYGDVRIGPGGDPSGDAIQVWQNGEITGEQGALTIPITSPQLIMPSSWPPSSGNIAYWSGDHTWSSNIRASKITVGNRSTVTITQPIRVWVQGDFAVQGNADISLSPGARVTFYVEGAVNFYNNATLNLNTGDPDRVRIYMTGSNRDITFTNRARLVGHVRNPEGRLFLWGQGKMPHSELFGSFFGRSLEMGNKTRVHVSPATQVGGSGSGGGSPGAIIGWAEPGPISGTDS